MAIITAFQFLSILPPLVRRTASERELGQAVGFFPLVGLVLGAVLVLAARGLMFLFPAQVAAILVLTVWVLFSGAFHLDALLDACDGLFGGQTPEQCLHIMRDERIGAFALVGGVLLLLGKYVVLATLLQAWSSDSIAFGHSFLLLILAPLLGRFAMSLAIVCFPYARSQGIGRSLKDYAGWPQAAVAGGIALLVALAVAGLPGGGLWAGTVLLTWLFGRWTMRRIPGLTGDTYGALCEITELAVLLVWTVQR